MEQSPPTGPWALTAAEADGPTALTSVGCTARASSIATLAGTAGRAGTLVGYTRVSSGGRLLERQRAALAAAGCTILFADTVVGRTARRPELAACLASLQPGDTLIVPSLEQLTRSVHELIRIVAGLRDRGVGLRSLHEALDTAGSDGQAVLAVFAALARFVHEAETEAARDGRTAARAGGQRLGRPPRLTPEQAAQARRLLLDPDVTVASVARQLGVGRSTLYRHLPELTGRPPRDHGSAKR